MFVLLCPAYFTQHNVLKAPHVVAGVRAPFRFKAEYGSVVRRW